MSLITLYLFTTDAILPLKLQIKGDDLTFNVLPSTYMIIDRTTKCLLPITYINFNFRLLNVFDQY